MESRPLGATGLKVPFLGLGTVKIGRNRDVKYPESFDLPDDAAVAELLDTAVEEGVVLWDTAPAYGSAEERLGPYVQRHRDRLVLCSKVGEEYDETGSRYDFSPAAIRNSVERSLRRLRTDRLDVCLLHSDGRDRELLRSQGVVDTLRELRNEGKVRAIGMSAKTVEGVDDAVESGLDVVMAPLSRQQATLGEALRRARSAGVGVLAIKVLAQGHALVARGTPADQLAQALDFAMDHGAVDAVVIGTRSADHLRESVRVVERLETRHGNPRR